MNLSESLEEVLRIINCTPDDVRRFVQQHPPEKRLTKVRCSIERPRSYVFEYMQAQLHAR